MRRWTRNILILSILVLPLAGYNTWGKGETGKTEEKKEEVIQLSDPSSGQTEPVATVQAQSDTDIFTNSIGMKFKKIPAGSFKMGSPISEKGRWIHEGPVHKITISKPFYLGVYEVTQEQWVKVMENNPSSNKGANKPVESISWNDAQKFIHKLSEKEKVEYRLPTEAEWEYACRSDTTTVYYWGDNPDSQYVWSKENSGGGPHDVGQLKPNAWGLFDMSGNVFEWCEDWFTEFGYVGSVEQTDPKGSLDGKFKVLRGGAWCFNSIRCRSAYRSGGVPDSRHNGVGLRLVRVIL